MKKKQYSIENLRHAVSISNSIAGVLRLLNLRAAGGNYKTIQFLIKENSIDTSHFTGQGWNVGLGFRPNRRIDNDTIFIKDSVYRCSWRLREHYKSLTGIDYCENCRLNQWQDQPIPLEIHHINGINTDNRLSNLQLLCPNCHALTDFYRGRAKKKPTH